MGMIGKYDVVHVGLLVLSVKNENPVNTQQSHLDAEYVLWQISRGAQVLAIACRAPMRLIATAWKLSPLVLLSLRPIAIILSICTIHRVDLSRWPMRKPFHQLTGSRLLWHIHSWFSKMDHLFLQNTVQTPSYRRFPISHDIAAPWTEMMFMGIDDSMMKMTASLHDPDWGLSPGLLKWREKFKKKAVFDDKLITRSLIIR